MVRSRYHSHVMNQQDVTLVTCVVLLSLWTSVGGIVQLRQNPDILSWVQWRDQYPRFWNRAMLSEAIVVPGLLQLAHFLHKLNMGLNVTVIAFGTSITSDLGGCFNPGLVRDMVAVPPHTHKIDKCWRGGWLDRFMTQINSTWPAQGHVLINMGIPGSVLAHRATGSCLEVSLPKKADLVIIENLAGLDNGGPGSATTMELLMTRLAHHFNEPLPAILVHTLLLAPRQEQAEACLRAANCTNCSASFPHRLTTEGNSVRYHEGVLNSVAEYYGYSAISLRNFYQNILRDGVPQGIGPAAEVNARLSSPADNVTRDSWFCEVLAEVQADVVHHRRGLGSQLFADLLINLLVKAELNLLDTIGNPKPVLFPRQPLYPGGHNTFVFRCYGHNDENLSAGSEVVAPMEMATVQGWVWTDYQMHGTVKKFKPGWVALAAGAVLQMVVNTSFPHLQQQPKVGLTYLVSYEHMGMARVSCASGCECSPFVINAHNQEQKVSVLSTADFDVTQAPRCTVQVEMLSNTTSGQTKFKVARIYVKISAGTFGGDGNASRWL